MNHCPACENEDYFDDGDENDCRCPEGCHQAAIMDSREDRDDKN